MLARAAPRQLVALLVLAAGCAREPRPPTDELRVISLSPSISGILVALGATPDVVGVDRYSAEVPGLEEVPSLGGLFAPDLERAIELRPTLVLGVKSAQQRPFFEQLRSRGVTTREVDPYSLEEVLATYAEIGVLVGRAAEAEALLERVRGSLSALAASSAGRPRPRVVMVVNREPLYVVGSGSFVSELIELAGGSNVFADLDAPYPQVSLEALAERAPDVLLDSTVPWVEGPEGREAREAREFWARFRWAGRVELIPTGVATLPGAEVARGARLIYAAVHAEPAP